MRMCTHTHVHAHAPKRFPPWAPAVSPLRVGASRMCCAKATQHKVYKEDVEGWNLISSPANSVLFHAGLTAGRALGEGLTNWFFFFCLLFGAN